MFTVDPESERVWGNGWSSGLVDVTVNPGGGERVFSNVPVDGEGNFDLVLGGEPFNDDVNENGVWDDEEPYTDTNTNGQAQLVGLPVVAPVRGDANIGFD